MTVVVLDQQRNVVVTNGDTVPQITVQSLGLQGPQGLPTIVNGKSGSSITLTASDVGAVPTTAEGAANGVATLDSSALVPIGQIPVTALSANFVDLSTNQTVNGIKTFGSIPVGPGLDPTTGNQLTRKTYVDNGLATKLNLSGGTLTGALTLSADPVSALQPATKQYVDALVQGLSPKSSVVAATTGALPANTYANGTSGVGATLTATANGALAAQDGVTLTVNQLLLVKNEATAANNGIYTLTQVGDASHPYILTRHVDMDQAAEIAGAFTFVESGTTNVGSGWTVASAGPFTVGTTAITWTQFSGAGEVVAGSGLSKTGNTLSIAAPVSIANGGTGSTTQNFVDLTTGQTIAGAKTFSNGVTVNSTTSLNGQVTVASGTANPSVQTTSTQAGGQIYRAIGADAASVMIEGEVTGDTVHRIATFLDGHTEIGPGGSTARDTVFGRAGVGILYTSKTLLVGASATLGSGVVGGIEVANAATPPGSTPTGGGVLYSSSGRPFWKDAAGNALTVGGMMVVTSTTHPASPFTGLEIFETDTGLSAAYSGSNYLYNLQQIAPTASVSAAASYTFTGLPAVNRLLLVWRLRSSGTGTTLGARLDGDSTGGHYIWAKMTQRGAAVSGSANSSDGYAQIGTVAGSGTANYFSSGETWLNGWNASNGYCNLDSSSSCWDTSSSYWIDKMGSLFLGSAAAHTSLTIFPGSGTITGELTLYGGY